MDDSKIISGFFRDIPISINTSSLTGGIKSSVKQFANKNTQNVETLGLKPRSYSFEIIINDKPNQDYFSYRDSLLAALENQEPTALIHPFYGRIEDVLAIDYSLNESIGEFGSATINVSFEVTDNTGLPQQSQNVLPQVIAQNDQAVAAINSDISSTFKVTQSFAGNFGAAIDKINSVVDSINSSTSFLGESADVINTFSSEVGELSANVNSLITNPIALADSITGIFSTINGLYASSESTFEAFKGFFNFGDDDVEINTTTAGLSERKTNSDVINSAVKAQGLCYCYVAAATIEYETVRDIDEVSSTLEDQFNIVMTSEISQETRDAITSLRLKTLELLKQERLNTNQIIEIDTLPTSARLLAFTYYGDDTLGDRIANLNGITDVSFVDGRVEVLTE